MHIVIFVFTAKQANDIAILWSSYVLISIPGFKSLVSLKEIESVLIDTFKLNDVLINDGQNHPLDKK